MNNLTYNPNVNIPYNNSYNNYNNINMDFDESGGNFNRKSNINSNYNMENMRQQMEPQPQSQYQYQPNIPMENSMNMPLSDMDVPMSQDYGMQPQYQQMMPEMQNQRYNRYQTPIKLAKGYKNKSIKGYKKNYTLDNFEDTSNTKINWMVIIKKIIIYTALFLVMSHIKMNELICKFIPFIGDNEILCMTTKGILLAIIIIVTQIILK